MKRFILFLLTVVSVKALDAQDITLVKKNKARSAIVIPGQPTIAELKAAAILQDYIRQISEASLMIHPDTDSAVDAEILIGKVNRAEARDISTDRLGGDGFIIRTAGNKLIITGGTDKGVLYGVYTFLEKYLGCRQYSSKVSLVPKKRSLVLHYINDTQIPSFRFRRIEYRDANMGEFADWNRVTDGHEWGTWCHTFSELLSPEEYGKTHPEYFSYYDSARHPELNADGEPVSQLCLSNPEVLRIVMDNLKVMIQKNLTAQYWSVSQNDNVRYCQCAECTKLNQQYAAAASADQTYATGTMKYASTGMGSVMYFLNQLSANFPDKVISTLAYQYTRKPPANITPANNINIMLSDIESPRGIPINKSDKPFANDLAGWGHISRDILVWDYVIQFRHLLAPFPNLRTLQPNIQFLHSNGVTALFEQGNRQSGGEFAELRAYLLTKLMWNADVNVDSVMDDFLSGYYGKAGNLIHAYINIMHDKLAQYDSSLNIFGSPVKAKDTYLSDSLITVYNNLFDRAERAVKNSPDILIRVQSARMPVYYAMLEIARAEKVGPRGAFITDANGVQKPDPKIEMILNQFVAHCIRTGVTRIAEWYTVPQDYLEAYNDFLLGKPEKPPKRLY